MQQEDKFALLVPCYNASAYIDQFLNSVNKLSRPFNEVLFYDDCSSDHTVEMLKERGQQVITGSSNQGPAYARNQLATATGCNWFHFHDIDDLIDPYYLEKTESILKSHDVDIVLCNVTWLDATNRIPVLEWNYSNSALQQDPLSYTISHPIGGINGLYRKSTFLQTGGFNTKYRIWEDADLHVRLAAARAKFYIIEETLSISLRYHGSASNDQVNGWLTRLTLLQNYGQKYANLSVQKTIGTQAQLTASRLLMSGEHEAAKSALQLSEECGVKVPESNNIIWKTLKFILPSTIRISIRLVQLRLAFKTS